MSFSYKSHIIYGGICPIPTTLSLNYKEMFWYLNLAMVYIHPVFSLKNWYGIFQLGIEQRCVTNVYPAPKVKSKQNKNMISWSVHIIYHKWYLQI